MAFLSIIGGVVGAIGAMQQGAAEAAQAKYQAAVAKNNKIIAEQSAVYTLQAEHVEEGASRIKTGQVIAQAHAEQGASGVETESGSPVKVRQSTAAVGEMDAMTIWNNAQMKARGF